MSEVELWHRQLSEKPNHESEGHPLSYVVLVILFDVGSGQCCSFIYALDASQMQGLSDLPIPTQQILLGDKHVCTKNMA